MSDKPTAQSSTPLQQGRKLFPSWLRWLLVCSILLVVAGVTLSTLIFPTQTWVGFVSTAIGALGMVFTFIPLAQAMLAPAKTHTAEAQPGIERSSGKLTPDDTAQPQEGNLASILLHPTSSTVPPVQPGDVFFFNESLPRTSEFYARDVERITVMNRLARRASTSIVGPRRMGKTWLLNYVRLTVQPNHDENVRVGYIDTTIPEFSIAHFTTRAINALGDIPDDQISAIGLMALSRLVEEMKARKQIPVLCIDEFEGFGTVTEFNMNFFTHLRAIAQLGLVLVTASKTPLIDIVGDIGHIGKTSGLFNIFEQLTLEPFSATEAQSFVDAKCKQAGFTHEERERLLHYGKIGETQWHPLRLQLTGKMLLMDKMLAAQGNPDRYRPRDLSYWEKFEQQLEEKYRGVVRL